MADYDSIKAKCLEEGTLFVDDDFPAKNSSIYYNREDTSIVWKRPKDIAPDPKFITDGASKYDLDQGKLGNCWFLAAAATLATKPTLFNKVVPQEQSFDQDYAGIFRFKFWRFGKWKDVFVDDRLPTKEGALHFCKNRESPNEFWSALLEKAYAKLHGSYQALEAGYSNDAFVDFTGGIGEFIDIRDTDTDRVLRLLKRVFKRETMMCAAIDVPRGGTYEARLPNGLVQGHVYSITNIHDVTVNNVIVTLLRLRNPWGRKEWKGAWSDNAAEWESLSIREADEMDKGAADDGEFWMTYDDFLQNFHSIQMCHLTPDTVSGGGGKKEWNIQSLEGSWVVGVTAGGCGAPPHKEQYWTNPQYFVNITDPDPDDDEDQCTVVVSLMQKFSRLKKTTAKREDTEEAIAFDVFRFRGDAPEVLDGFEADSSALRLQLKMPSYEYMREKSARLQLNPGVYCLIPCTYDPDREGEFLLRVATETPVQVGDLDEDTVPSKPPKKDRKFIELFQKHCGGDDVIDARELRKMLNEGLMKDKDEAFTKDSCRALIQSITGDRKGTLDMADTKQVWNNVKNLQAKFDDFDKDSSGTLDVRELRRGFKSIGYKMSKKSLVAIVNKYCGKGNSLSIDDFILVATKIANSHEAFQRVSHRSEDDKVVLSREEFLNMTL